MDINTRISIVKLYYANGGSPTLAMRAYKKLNNLHKDPFTISAVVKLMERFESTGSVHDRPRTGRPSLVEDRGEAVLHELERQKENHPLGLASASSVSRTTDIPRASVNRILKHYYRFYPYKLRTTQAITEDDQLKRLEFSEFITNCDEIGAILWSDEANFSIDGSVNTHNAIIWGTERPPPHQRPLHSPHMTVWMGFSREFKLKPYFFNSTVTSESYKLMLQTHMIPQLQAMNQLPHVIFQHDGAPPHFGRIVTALLKETFGDNVIGRGFPHHWPPRSPDLAPLDYYFWGMLKTRVYSRGKPQNLIQLQEWIERAIEEVEQEEIACAVDDLFYRCDLLKECNGNTFEHLL